MIEDIVSKRLEQVKTAVTTKSLRNEARRDLARIIATYLVGIAAMVAAILGLAKYIHEPAYPPGSTVTIQVPK
jgi:uncharacterized protein YbgA (DUF1722 family)